MKTTPLIFKLFITFILILPLYAKNYPLLFTPLSIPLYEVEDTFITLAKLDVLQTQHDTIKIYIKDLHTTMDLGFEADISKDDKTIKKYFKSLRVLQKLHDKIEKDYKQKLYKSIYDKDTKSFYKLICSPLPFIHEDTRLKKKVVEFYRQSKNSMNCKDKSWLQDLAQDFDLDESSYAYMDSWFQVHSQKQASVQTRKQLDVFTPNINAKKMVEVISVKTQKGFTLYLENNAYSDISIKLFSTKMINLLPSQNLPYIASFPARSRTKVLEFNIADFSKASTFQMHYNSMMGTLNPNYNENYLYALPYKRGQGYTLTQGFNGSATHKGRSAYALDFDLPIGTEIHAMRDGIVTAVEDKHTEHGFSDKFADKANHIVILHDDGTMAMYGHLNTNGVRVKVGQKIYKHMLIGYSGNTGYSSGPHLHVHISVIKSFDAGSSSVHFKFMAKRGRIDKPQERLKYIAK